MVLVVNLLHYFFKDKKFSFSFANDLGKKNKIEKNKTRIIK